MCTGARVSARVCVCVWSGEGVRVRVYVRETEKRKISEKADRKSGHSIRRVGRT